MSKPPRLWALLIGNASYKALMNEDGEPLKDLEGPEEDVDRLCEFLLDDLQVPRSNVKCLKNATRKEMLDSFQSHLIDNKKIHFNDPLLFYYSGHGGRTVSPEGWPTLLDSKGERKTEQIIPSDCAKGGDGNEPVKAIPDRTINALLSDAADKHGDNITVILDCCFAAHATRIGDEDDSAADDSIRGIPECLLPPLTVDTDVDVWRKEVSSSASRGNLSKSMRVLGDPACRSHVLLAACRVNQTAKSNTDPELTGGYFTFALLSALDNWQRSRVSWTYLEVIRHVQENMRKLENLKKQIPECSGWLLERPLFQPFVDRRRFTVECIQGDSRTIQVLGGHLHAIVRDTVFALFDAIDSLNEVARVAPYEVTATTSLVALPEGVEAKRTEDSRLSISHASVVRPGTTHRLRIHIPAETAALHRDAFELLRNHSVDLTDDRQSAELIIEKNLDHSGSFTLTRNDTILSQEEPTKVVHIEMLRGFYFLSVDDIIYRLSLISAFNFHLYHTPASHPFYPNIVVRFGVFRDGSRLSEPQIAREFVEGKTIPSTEDTEVKLRSGESYALVIKNDTSHELFFYVLYFDPLKYGIILWYQPQSEQTFVRPHDTLQLGRSPEKKGLLKFKLNSGQNRDIGFMKIYALPKYVDMQSLSQKGLYSNKPSRGDGTQSLSDDVVGDQWDMVRFKIVCSH